MNLKKIREISNRGWIFSISVMLLIAIVSAIFKISMDNKINYVQILVLLGLLCVPLVIVLTIFNTPLPDGPAENSFFHSDFFNALEESEQFITCRFTSKLGDVQAVILVDLAAESLSFHNCEVSNRFISRRLELVDCNLQKIKGIQTFLDQQGSYLTIITDAFKAEIPSDSQNYEKLLQYLKSRLPMTERVFAMQNPLMPYTFIALTLVGVGLGVFLTPLGATDQRLGLTVILCAIMMALLNYLTIRFIEKWFQYDMTYITGSVVLCLIPGMQFSLLAMYVSGLNLVVMAGVICSSLLTGLILGILKKPLF